MLLLFNIIVTYIGMPIANASGSQPDSATAPISKGQTPDNIALYGNHTNLATSSKPHETILQTLNRWLAYENGNTYLSFESFSGTEADWDTVPVIYAQDHLDMRLVIENVDEAIRQVGGRLLPPGTVTNCSVIKPGQPRLVADTQFTDSDLQKLYNEGKLSLSTGFFAKVDEEGKIIGKVVPNHILIFKQDDTNQPRDKGAMFLNKQEQEMPDSEQITNKGAVFSKKNRSLIEQAVQALTAMMAGWSADEPEKDVNLAAKQPGSETTDDTMDTEKLTALENKVKELTAKEQEFANTIKTKDEAIAKLNTELSEMKAKVAADAENAVWSALKNELPKGWTETPEIEAKTREEWLANKDAFLIKVAKLPKTAPTTEEGNEFPNNTGTDSLTLQKELLTKANRFRR